MTKRWMKGEIARGLLLLALGTILASGTVFAETGAGEAAFANSFKNNEGPRQGDDGNEHHYRQYFERE